MHPHPITVTEAIRAHQSAYAVDDALYDDDGQAKSADVQLIEASDRMEIVTLRDFARARCLSHDDVQAKLKYLLTGTSAHQCLVWDALDLDRYADEDWKGTGESPLLQECIATLLLEGSK